MAAQANSETISKITEKEKEITSRAQPVKGGPTAQAQKHAGEDLSSAVISDITAGEKAITGGGRVKGGPTSAAQRMASQVRPLFALSHSPPRAKTIQSNNTSTGSLGAAAGTLDSATISKITAAEKKITGADGPVKGGPTAQAQKHAGERISSEALHDITEGEKKIAGEGTNLKGGPTSAAQSELGRARNRGQA